MATSHSPHLHPPHHVRQAKLLTKVRSPSSIYSSSTKIPGQKILNCACALRQTCHARPEWVMMSRLESSHHVGSPVQQPVKQYLVTACKKTGWLLRAPQIVVFDNESSVSLSRGTVATAVPSSTMVTS